MSEFIDLVKATWSLLSFPWLFIFFIAVGFIWLWLEKLLTRLGRATPGIRGPLPLTTSISSAAIFVIIWSKRLVYFWIFLYALLLLIFLLASQEPDFPPEIAQIALKIGQTWNAIYAFLMDVAPIPFLSG